MIVSALVLTSILKAAAAQSAPPDPFVEATRLSQEGKTLAAIAVLERASAAEPSGRPGRATQSLAGELAVVGETDRAMALYDGPPDPRADVSVPASIPELEGATPEDAIAAIVRAAKGRRIVILNEAHHVPRGRAFAFLLARALRKAGFDTFAAETFAPDAPAAYAKGVPNRAMGYYVGDPFFGDLVRETMRLGYRGLAYEAEDLKREGDVVDRINEREAGEARNLDERWFQKRPRSRIFVYCGFMHATEDWSQEDGKELAWMAARLAKRTGLDPLAIDQSEEIPHPSRGAETPEYRYADARGLLADGPKVFRKPGGAYATMSETWRGRVDMQVFAPRDASVMGRPSWTLMGGVRKPVYPPADALPKAGRVLLQAFASKEGDDIPVDQVLATDGRAAALMLPKGSFRLAVQDEAGVSRPVGRITVR